VESTPAADFESARQSRKADPFYQYNNHRNRLFGGIQSGMMNRYYDNYYFNSNNQEDYYPYYDDYYIPPHPGRRHELFNQRRRPQLQQQQHILPFDDETDVIDAAEEGHQSEAASFKRLFNSFSTLFSTFVLTLTTTTGTSTVIIHFNSF